MSGNYTSLYPALYPLYDFSHWFLGSVLHTKTLNDIANEIDLSNPGEIFENFASDWQFWANYFIGFAVLTGFGIAYIFAFPLTGICTCSCRVCCGKCGANGSKRHSSCKNVCCSTWLCCLVFILLLGVVWSILASVALWEETKQDTGAVSELQTHFQAVDRYREATNEEIDLEILWNFAEAKNTIFSILDNAGPMLILNLGEATQAGPALEELEAWVASLTTLESSLQQAQTLIASLQYNGTLLATELATLQADVSSDASLCAGFEPLCQTLEEMAINTTMGVDYDQLQDQEVDLALTSITYAVNDDILGSIEAGVLAFLAIGDEINTKLEPSITQLKSSVEQVESELIKYTDQVKETMEKLSTNKIVNKLEEIEPDVEKYGTINFWCSIALSCVLGLIVVFYYWGLLIGTCCKKSTSCCCSRKTAASCLLSANCCSFLFAWLLMLVATVGLLTGGPAYTEICRHLTNMETSETIGLIDDVLTDSLGYNLSIADTVAECRNDSSAYLALQLEQYGVNITAVLDLDQYDVKQYIDALKLIEVDVGTVTILTQQANETLLVALAGLAALNFTWNYEVLKQDIVLQDLEELAQTLEAAANNIAMGTLKQQLFIHANTSRELNLGLVESIDRERKQLYTVLQSIERDVNAHPIDELIVNISIAQDNLNAYGNEYISAQINASADQLYSIMSESLAGLETSITEDIGRCQSLYLAVEGIIDVACVQVVDAYNAFWLSFGWTVWLLIPCVAIGYSLADHYKRSMQLLKLNEDDPDSVEIIRADDTDTESFQLSDPNKTKAKKKNQVAPAPSNSSPMICEDV